MGFAEIVRVVANNIPSITNGALGLKEFRLTQIYGGITVSLRRALCHD